MSRHHARRELEKAQLRFERERDRRYSELRAADQRALQIKEAADATALTLAAALQAEKDDRRNDILERWNQDRGTFITREEYQVQHNALADKIATQLGPIFDFIAGQRGSESRTGSIWTRQFLVIMAVIGVAAVIVAAILAARSSV